MRCEIGEYFLFLPRITHSKSITKVTQSQVVMWSTICMNQSISVSVIIPLYNVKPFVSQCLDSLLAQTLTAFELLVVNDGSTDGSEMIVEEYSKKDPRIHLFHQSNQGVAVARNTGILHAKGEYITFVDADDFVEKDYLEHLYQSAIQYKTSIVVANFKSEIEGKWVENESVYDTNRLVLKEEIQQNILSIFLTNDSLNSCCVKLFDKQLIQDNRIQFPAGMTNGEDALFCLKAFSLTNTVVFTKLSGYCYRAVSGSASRNFLSKDYLKIALENYEFDHQSYAQLSLDSRLIQRYKSHRLMNTLYDLIHIYLRPNAAVSWLKRVQKVRAIMKHPRVQEVFKVYGVELEQETFGYRKQLLQSIRKNRLFVVLGLTFYSNFRNHYYFTK